MDIRAATLCLGALIGLSACGASSRPAMGTGGSRATVMECAPYARQVSGIQLYGDAADWWEAAAGRYGRSAQPSPGAVLVFRRSPRLPHGHVSVVASVRSAREISVTQANWVHGRIARSEPVVDVSAGNDWTDVRVWWEPAGQLGSSVYPTFGFIADDRRQDLRISDGGPVAGRPADGVAGVLCPASDKTAG